MGTGAQYCLLDNDDDTDDDVGGDDDTEETLHSRCLPLHMSAAQTKKRNLS
jgi:hypothetical protein